MLNLLEVYFKGNGELFVQLNEDLMYLFETEEELLSLVDEKALEKALQEALIPLSNKILKKAKEVYHNE